MLYTIWDIDNCLADDHWRQGTVDWHLKGDERYDRYNLEAVNDRLVHGDFFKLFVDMGASPIFITGRPEKHRGITQEWLHRTLGIVEPVMYMRPNGTVGVTPRALKEELLNRFWKDWMQPGDRIIGAFDDLDAVVEMYRSNNIPAAKLCINADLSKVYEPADLV